MRSILHLSIFVPALAGAALYTGTVSSLENHPIAGVVVKLGSDSVITGHDGTWSLSRTVGIQARDAQAIDGTRHLVRDGSRLSLAWQDHDILGRGPAIRENLPSNQRTAIGARTMASTDTIVIRWKGKNLSRIPVFPSDTTIAQAIDTSWKDDAGISWNPSIAYGSLPDTRDGQTYRTVKIGTQTWMAENLNVPADSSWCYANNTNNCSVYGRLYSWTAAMALASSFDVGTWSGDWKNRQGLCPTGWRVPSDSDWTYLAASVGLRRGIEDSMRFDTADGLELESTMGWSYRGGTDRYGFRGLPAGHYGLPLSPSTTNFAFEELSYDTRFWTATEYDFWHSFRRGMSNGGGNIYRYWGGGIKREGYSLRCLED